MGAALGRRAFKEMKKGVERTFGGERNGGTGRGVMGEWRR